jgi:glycosyltransferase involved in cell wall biosynthesis
MSGQPLILGHTGHSLGVHRAGLGEVANLHRFCGLVDEPLVVRDIYEWFGGGREAYRKLDAFSQAGADRRLMRGPVEWEGPVILWTWDHLTFALLEHGVSDVPLITFLISAQPGERVPEELHERSTLVACHSLQAVANWIDQGLEPWKVFYLPHHWVEAGGERVAHKGFRIGCVNRFLPHKNVERAVWAVKELHEEFPEVHLYLKGRYDESDWGMRQLMGRFHGEPWLVWDWKVTPFPEVLDLYRTFDLSLNLTGGELASTATIEQLALGVPSVMLRGGTNESLFEGAVAWVKNRGPAHMRKAKTWYHLPDDADLTRVLRELVRDGERREALGREGERLARLRFSPKLAREKARLLLAAARGLHAGEAGWKETLIEHGCVDRRTY